jgi:DNA polymerase V
METADQSLLFLGSIQAGFPSPAADYMQERISLDAIAIRNPSSTFFFRVEGESMTGAFIPPDALLVVDRSVKPSNGSIVVAVVDNEYTVKRLKIEGVKRQLVPESSNRKFRPIEINEFTQCEIWGVVTYILTDAKGV